MQSNCIVIPVYNNVSTINAVVNDALKTGATVVVVDDGSEPDVVLEIESNKLYLLKHAANAGKGKAILTGAQKAKALGFSSFFIVDADGQHFPKEIENFTNKNLEECIVIGCRRFGENVPGSSKFGRKFSNFWIWSETGLHLDDTQSGFRSYPISVLDLDLQQKHYDFEIEVLVKHVWSGGCIEEVEVDVYYPKPEERVSHFHAFNDNFRLTKLHSRLVFKRLLHL